MAVLTFQRVRVVKDNIVALFFVVPGLAHRAGRKSADGHTLVGGNIKAGVVLAVAAADAGRVGNNRMQRRGGKVIGGFGQNLVGHFLRQLAGICAVIGEIAGLQQNTADIHFKMHALPVALPVEPTYPMTSPAVTVSPSFKFSRYG